MHQAATGCRGKVAFHLVATRLRFMLDFMLRCPAVRIRDFAALLVAAGVLLASWAPAQSITSAVDTIYTETWLAGSNVTRLVFHLRAGGVARKLYSRSTGPALDYAIVYGPSEELHYVYTPPTDENPTVGSITFSGGSDLVNGARSLQFFNADAKEGNLSTVSTFSFSIRTELNGALNVSNRCWVRPGETAITGFVVDRMRMVLIRGVGPGLQRLGVPVTTPDPSLTLYAGPIAVALNDQWGTEGPDAQGMAWIFELVGAFPLTPGSNDAALFTSVDPGLHTVHLRDPGTTTSGEAIAEVYILPYE
jgi:hypothetical protein